MSNAGAALPPRLFYGGFLSGTIPLRPAEVHVWRVSLRRSPQATASLRALLSPEEDERTELQATDRLRRRFVVAHAEARRILAGYLGEDPRALVFAVHPEGKPHLFGAGRELHFNLSHSGELALLAVSSHREVGIDVEWIDPRRDLGALLPAFTPEERAELERIPDAVRRRAALFAAWTRKEAYLKAKGRGIGWGLTAADGAEELARWTLVDLDCGDDYRAALAAEGSGWGVCVFDSAEV